jgi:hypothetical protein
MAKYSVDFTDVDNGGGFTPISKGEHEAYVFEMEAATSQAGNEMLKVTFKIANGDDKGKTVWHYLVFTKKAMFKIKEFVVACGDTKSYAGEEIDFDVYKGKKVILDITHEIYNEKDKAVIKEIKSCEDNDAEVETDRPF